MNYQRHWSYLSTPNLETTHGITEQLHEFKVRKKAKNPDQRKQQENLSQVLPAPSRFFHHSVFQQNSATKLGQGGFGDVYLVKHKMLPNKDFVLKRFRRNCPNCIPWKELDVLAYLNHPNICRMYGAFCSDLPTLVLETCLGSSHDFIDALETEHVIQIIVQIAKALEYMHEKNFIHCDVKPTNILIRPNNVAVLGDFGCCLYLNGETFHAGDNTLGTESFLNLEALETGHYSRKTDLWALACTAFRLEMKNRIVPQPNFKGRNKYTGTARQYYAEAIRSGIKESNGKRKKFREFLMECKTLHGILLLLTQDEGSCTATEFLTNKLVHQTMEKYGRCMTRINEVEQKFATEYATMESNSTRTFSSLPFAPNSNPDLAKFYWESDGVRSISVGGDPNPIFVGESKSTSMTSIDRNTNQSEIPINDGCNQKAPRTIPDRTVEAFKSLNVSEQSKTNMQLETGLPATLLETKQSRPKKTLNHQNIAGECRVIDLDAQVYFCYKCRLFVCLKLALIRAHTRKCRKKSLK